ncbi:MAG: LysE/ArgO family amino acid transporter [Paracoccaceae bacterium]
MVIAAFAGFRLGLGLIIAIGAQNVFVLRQGLRREHVFAVCLFCALSDALLIAAGVSGFALASNALPWLVPFLRWGGVIFLFLYGARAFWAAWSGTSSFHAGAGNSTSLGRVIATAAAMTWLNPHVYLDTVVLLGSVGAQYPGQALAFGAGAVTASFLFFFALGYGARLLAPLLARPAAPGIIELLVGLLMWSLAFGLVMG